MGRQDLSHKFDWLRVDEDSDIVGKLVDIRKDLPEDLRKEVELKRRKPEDLCWIMGHECWVCELWNYYLPMITKQDISEVENDSPKSHSHNPQQLTEIQERIFEKIIYADKQAYENLEYTIPYIVGNMTRSKFIRLEPF